MSKERHFSPFKAGLVIGVSLGAAAGIYGTLVVKKNQKTKPEAILASLKKAFQAEGPIEGSWIEHEPVFIDHIVKESKAYNGGIVRYEGDALVVYEFMADANTGAIISITQLESE